MNILNRLLQLTVKIGDGSGSGYLFQPKSNGYTYVLTAAHVLKNQSNLTITRQILDDQDSQIIKSIEIIGNPYYHENSDKDAAIIKIKAISGIEDLLPATTYEDFNKYYLIGYPDVRKGISPRVDGIKQVLHKTDHGYIEAELEKFTTHSELIGQSGGGIIGIYDNKYFLLGIQKGMIVNDAQESLGHISFMPLSFFEEITRKYPKELSELTSINKETLSILSVDLANDVPDDKNIYTLKLPTLSPITDNLENKTINDLIKETQQLLWRNDPYLYNYKTRRELAEELLNNCQLLTIKITKTFDEIICNSARRESWNDVDRKKIQNLDDYFTILERHNLRNSPILLFLEENQKFKHFVDRVKGFYQYALNIKKVTENGIEQSPNGYINVASYGPEARINIWKTEVYRRLEKIIVEYSNMSEFE